MFKKQSIADDIMKKVSIEDRGVVAILRLTNGVTNAISPELVKDLSIASTQIRNEFKGMILAGGTRFFSIGLSLPEWKAIIVLTFRHMPLYRQ